MAYAHAAGGSPGTRIDLLSDMDIAYWCQVLGVDPHELRQAVQHVGPQVAAVRRYVSGPGHLGPDARPRPLVASRQ